MSGDIRGFAYASPARPPEDDWLTVVGRSFVAVIESGRDAYRAAGAHVTSSSVTASFGAAASFAASSRDADSRTAASLAAGSGSAVPDIGADALARLAALAAVPECALEEVVSAIPIGPGGADSFAVVHLDSVQGDRTAGWQVTAVTRGRAVVDVYSVGGSRRFSSSGVQPWLIATFRDTIAVDLGGPARRFDAVANRGPGALEVSHGMTRSGSVLWSGAEIGTPFRPTSSGGDTAYLRPAAALDEATVLRRRGSSDSATELPDDETIRIARGTASDRSGHPDGSHGSDRSESPWSAPSGATRRHVADAVDDETIRIARRPIADAAASRTARHAAEDGAVQAVRRPEIEERTVLRRPAGPETGAPTQPMDIPAGVRMPPPPPPPVASPGAASPGAASPAAASPDAAARDAPRQESAVRGASVQDTPLRLGSVPEAASRRNGVPGDGTSAADPEDSWIVLVGVRGGEARRLEVPIVFGRRPASGARSGAQPELVTVASPGRVVSASHVRVERVGSSVVITDLRSRNGTTVHLAGRAPRRLRPGESIAIAGTASVDIGDGTIIDIIPEAR